MRDEYLHVAVASLLAVLLCQVVSTIPILGVHVVSATVQKYEKVLRVIGANGDLRVFAYHSHTVSSGFAVSLSTFRPVRPNEESFTKAGFAVQLGSSWVEGSGIWAHEYIPHAGDMWVKLEGNSFFRPEVHPNGIATNHGTGSECTPSWATVLKEIILFILPYILEKLAETPPAKEWQSDLHWLKAITRQGPDPLDKSGRFNGALQTAGCDLDMLFQGVTGYQYLTVTAGAHIRLEDYQEGRDIPRISYIDIGDYSVQFQVEVPVTNEPNDPSKPSGQTLCYAGASYSYSTSATDPNGNNVRYVFDWGDGTTYTTGWYASGGVASASHSWSSSGIYPVKVQAQDIYDEPSGWSPFLTVDVAGPIQLREFDFASSYNPDIRFSKPNNEWLRIDSYSAGAGSLGKGYAFFVIRKDMLQGNKIKVYWNIYHSYPDQRDLDLGTVYVFNAAFDRRDTSSYFKPDQNREPMLDYVNIKAFQYPFQHAVGWSGWYTNTSTALDMSSWASQYVTVLIRLADNWVQDTVIVDIDYLQILDPSNNVLCDFQFRESIVMETSGTLNDYGRLG